MFTKRIRNKLNLQAQSGLLRRPPEINAQEGVRVRVGDRWILNFASNDYLGLAADPDLHGRVAGHFATHGSSASSSRLVSANYSLLNRAEQAYADYFGHEAALFFSSGFQANLAVLSTLFERGDTVFFDKRIHASSVKGLQLSGATLHGFRHNDLDHLKRRLKRGAKYTGVVTESLFSMDGDLLDPAGLAALKAEAGFLSVVDEAHALGVLGDEGRGLAGATADVVVGTFGKAFGLFGAFVLLPAEYKAYLMNFSAPLIFSTALPRAHAAAALDVLDKVRAADAPRAHLRNLSRYLKEKLQQAGLPVKGDAHILAVDIGPESQAAALASHLFDQGIWLLAARFPTVPLSRAMLRISLTAAHALEDVDILADALTKAYFSKTWRDPHDPGDV